ncbi:MAG: 4-hydroxy-tetrahydrodipicolinate reductase [Alphaproteobacteria bacterium]|nr:4-hydroxy-tetrahydrodipicolinate reductase [Alphaproteobacteria bacterium]MDE1937839.1 4-hydroxy-tetrahydrodipicolinate reductase [Alphaproteobacteria bacterium]MDE2109622.1 4-hydroxy-tetrahydrodipicolinate reductase [Alphaproteobacteria bacterium]MDE2493042.1 4-hydroxy-tetrahydrodipicolinate reductase [Alphaproteobacteria bacterium]
MSDVRIVVAGASGRMGRALIRAIAETKNCVLAGAFEAKGHPDLGQDAGVLAGLKPVGILLTDAPAPLLAKAQAVVDFTAPRVSVVLAALAAETGAVHVIGTTGCSADDEAKIADAAKRTVVVKSGNMSLGVTLLAALTKQAAKALPDFDVEIVEMHHNKKVDAPSGTALLLGEAAAQGRGVSLSDHAIRARDGHTGARPDGAIGFASLRGGTVVGEHDVILAGAGERIVLSHIAEDRAIFARGAVAAALWGQGKKPGLYAMSAVLGL